MNIFILVHFVDLIIRESRKHSINNICIVYINKRFVIGTVICQMAVVLQYGSIASTLRTNKSVNIKFIID